MSEWTRQHLVTARLSTLDPDIPCVQNKCGHIFPSTASKSLLLSASFLSTPNMPQFFPGEMTLALGRGDLASLLTCCAAFQLRCQPGSLQWCWCWDVAYSRTGMAVSHLVQSSCQRQWVPISNSRSLFLLCVCVTSELLLCWEAALLFVSGCPCKGTYNPVLWSANQSLCCSGSLAKRPS